MKKLQYSPTYVHILDLLFKLKSQKVPGMTQIISGGKLNIIPTGATSDKVLQELFVSASELWELCNNPHEWFMIGRIGNDLKYGNALWEVSDELKSRSKNRQILASLIRKGLLIPTETTNIYIVNPFYLRKGDMLRVLYGTAEILADNVKVLPEHIRSIKVLTGTDFTADKALLGL